MAVIFEKKMDENEKMMDEQMNGLHLESKILYKITECYCHGVSNARPNGLILKRPDHTSGTEKAYLLYVFSCVWSTHPIWQISIHNLSSCKCKASHQYASFDEPLNGWTWYSFCHTQGDHRYESEVFVSVWPFSNWDHYDSSLLKLHSNDNWLESPWP